MVEISPATSRRALLGVLAVAPIATLPVMSPRSAAIGAMPYAETDEPVLLRRSREGRICSRFRYHNAESFFLGVERGILRDHGDRLYQVGIVLQLGLSSHLLDVGFEDTWCARHIGLNVARSLAYANATGLDQHSPDLRLLTAILSPYWKWRNASDRHPPCDCPFSDDEIRQLTRATLERVREVTGHPRPRGWRRRFQ